MSLFKPVKKKNFLTISLHLSEIVTFWPKRVLCEFPQKCLKTTENHSLAVCGSHWGEKEFFSIFLPFYWFDQKQLFKQIQIFLRICPLSNMLRKTNFLTISALFSEIVTLWRKREVLCEFQQKCFKTTEKHSLAVCGSLLGEKQSLLIIVHLTALIKNNCLNKSKYSLGFFPFQTC